MVSYPQIIKLFLRLAVASSMLSAVADRFGWWPHDLCVWGDMTQFAAYTQTILPWVPAMLIPLLAWTATALEIIFSLCLLLGFRLKWVSPLTGLLILSFALAMATATGIKAPLDYSAFNASAAAFAIALCGRGIWEIDHLWKGETE